MHTSRKSSGNVRRLTLASAISAIVSGSGAVFAQDESSDAEGDEVVVVTGSRIVRRDLTSNSPILTIDEERFELSSTIAMESVLNQLPQFVPAVTQFQPVPPGELSNTGDPSVTPTASTISLRGLGSNRNLVLLNGRRAMPVDATMAVDINNIPSAAIERVETITGGASSVYGADAVAGVTNFIVKENFEGFEVDAQYGETFEGDGSEQSISALFGTNFGENGNIMLGIERYERGIVWQRDRDFYTQGWADPRSKGGQQVFWTAPYIGRDPSNPYSQAALDTVFGAGAVSEASGGNYYLNNDGTVYRTAADGNFRYNGPTTTADGLTYRKIRADNGALLENWVDFQESSPASRQSIFGRAHHEINENISAFGQIIYAESDSKFRRRVGGMVGGWGGTVPHGDTDFYGPSVISLGADGLPNTADSGEDMTTNVDYVMGGRFGLNCPAIGGCVESDVWPKSPEADFLLDNRVNDPNADVTVGVATTWLGNARNRVDVSTFHMVAGLEGQFENRDWTWELYFSNGNSKTQNETLGNVSVERWRWIINQPNYGTGAFASGNQAGNGFGAGSLNCTSGFQTLGNAEIHYLEFTGYQDVVPSQDCQDAVGAQLVFFGEIKQSITEFNIQGGLAELPAGQLRFAAGLSARENEFRWVPPPLATPESVFDLASGQYPRSDTYGIVATDEIYGELLVPLISGRTGAQALNLELGYRTSDNSPTQSTDSYKALIDWQVHDRVRIRGGHQVANRAPNVAELFQTANERLIVGGQGDWCSDLNNGNPLAPNVANPNASQVRAICESIMGPTGAANYYNDPNRNAGGLQFFFTFVEGNRNLIEETAGTTTFGAVIDVNDQITMTFDYWNIKINNMISSQDPNGVYQTCLSPETNPGFDASIAACQQISRNPETGGEGNTLLIYTNQGAVDFAGYDITVDWFTDLGPGQLGINSVITLTDKVQTQVSPGAAWNEWKGTDGPADLTGLNGFSYDYRTFVSTSYQTDKWTGILRWRHLPSIESRFGSSPAVQRTPASSYDMFDVAGSYRLGDDSQWVFRFGIDNLLDTDPERLFPTFTSATNFDDAAGETASNFYDILGRRFYVGAKLSF
jgi:outer membrane receptor protein involved in Fe transport